MMCGVYFGVYGVVVVVVVVVVIAVTWPGEQEWERLEMQKLSIVAQALTAR